MSTPDSQTGQKGSREREPNNHRLAVKFLDTLEFIKSSFEDNLVELLGQFRKGMEEAFQTCQDQLHHLMMEQVCPEEYGRFQDALAKEEKADRQAREAAEDRKATLERVGRHATEEKEKALRACEEAYAQRISQYRKSAAEEDGPPEERDSLPASGGGDAEVPRPARVEQIRTRRSPPAPSPGADASTSLSGSGSDREIRPPRHEAAPRSASAPAPSDRPEGTRERAAGEAGRRPLERAPAGVKQAPTGPAPAGATSPVTPPTPAGASPAAEDSTAKEISLRKQAEAIPAYQQVQDLLKGAGEVKQKCLPNQVEILEVLRELEGHAQDFAQQVLPPGGDLLSDDGRRTQLANDCADKLFLTLKRIDSQMAEIAGARELLHPLRLKVRDFVTRHGDYEEYQVYVRDPVTRHGNSLAVARVTNQPIKNLENQTNYVTAVLQAGYRRRSNQAVVQKAKVEVYRC
jgi:hypothetical protein